MLSPNPNHYTFAVFCRKCVMIGNARRFVVNV
jgi:hypothetical protein